MVAPILALGFGRMHNSERHRHRLAVAPASGTRGRCQPGRSRGYPLAPPVVNVIRAFAAGRAPEDKPTRGRSRVPLDDVATARSQALSDLRRGISGSERRRSKIRFQLLPLALWDGDNVDVCERAAFALTLLACRAGVPSWSVPSPPTPRMAARVDGAGG